MSSVSTVFHTILTVRMGLKTQLEWEHIISIKPTFVDYNSNPPRSLTSPNHLQDLSVTYIINNETHRLDLEF